jgi:hypothetical protein
VRGVFNALKLNRCGRPVSMNGVVEPDEGIAARGFQVVSDASSGAAALGHHAKAATRFSYHIIIYRFISSIIFTFTGHRL